MPAGGRGQSQGWRAGLRVGFGLAVAAFALAVSLGATAVSEGWPAWLVVLMSAVVFAGGAQFALLVAFGDGGIVAALGAATLINLRFVPMGITVSRSLTGGSWARSVQSQAVVDGSWAAARRPDGSVNREVMIAASLVQWPAWVAGTAIGAYLTPGPDLAHALGLDAISAAFFLLFALDAVREEPRHRLTACAAALIAAVMCLFLPPGAALLCAGAAAVLALRQPGGRG